MTILEIFRTVASEFADVTDEKVLLWIELTKPLVSKKKFRKLYEQAVALMVAHRMKLAGVGVEDSVSGNNPANDIDTALRVGSYSEGGVSISNSISGQSAKEVDGDLALTVYGLQYLALRRLVIIPIISAGEAP